MMCNKVKALTKHRTPTANTALKKKDGTLIFEIEDILERWNKKA